MKPLGKGQEVAIDMSKVGGVLIGKVIKVAPGYENVSEDKKFYVLQLDYAFLRTVLAPIQLEEEEASLAKAYCAVAVQENMMHANYSRDLETDETPNGRPRCTYRWTQDGGKVRCTMAATKRIITMIELNGEPEADSEAPEALLCDCHALKVGDHYTDNQVVTSVEQV